MCIIRCLIILSTRKRFFNEKQSRLLNLIINGQLEIIVPFIGTQILRITQNKSHEFYCYDSHCSNTCDVTFSA